jgi:hypothetical protein
MRKFAPDLALEAARFKDEVPAKGSAATIRMRQLHERSRMHTLSFRSLVG